MPVINKLIYQNGAATPGVSLMANDTLTVTDKGHIFATGTDGHGVLAAGNSTMFIHGSINSSRGAGIYGASGSHEITIGATGAVSSVEHGIYVEGSDNTITNAGEINAGSYGVLFGGAAGSNTVINSGTIRSGGVDALLLTGNGNSLTNSGLIEASDAYTGAYVSGNILNTATGTIRGKTGVLLADNMAANVLVNNGTIESITPTFDAVVGSAGTDVVVNNGSIEGGPGGAAINLQGGNDTYDGTGGGTLIGSVLGGAGDDKLVGGASAETLSGDDNNDTLNGGGGADTLYGGDGNDTFVLGADLSDTLGDTSGIDVIHTTVSRSIPIADIENLILLGNANINGTGNGAFNSIVGNGGNNILAGQAGNDVLVGGGGADQLFGQADKDSLTGGAGNDKFGFQTVAHTAAGMGDVIVDFDDGSDDLIDLSGIAGVSSFIGGAAFSAAGQVRATQVGANVLIEINTAGVNVAEGEITLLNTTLAQVNGADFLL